MEQGESTCMVGVRTHNPLSNVVCPLAYPFPSLLHSFGSIYFLIHISLFTNKYAFFSISTAVHFRVCSLLHHRALLGSGLCPHADFTSHQRESLCRKHISFHPKHHKLHSPLPVSFSGTQRILYRGIRLCSLLPSPVWF